MKKIRLCKRLRCLVYPRHHRIGKEHAPEDELERRLREGALQTFSSTDQPGGNTPFVHHNHCAKIGI
mgnify:CR=1 FL=1